MTVLVVLGGGGGIVALIGAIIIVGRGVFRQVGATEDNTQAIKALTDEVAKIRHNINGHETRIAILEDRGRR